MATRASPSARPPAGRLAKAVATARAALVRFGVFIIAAALVGVAVALVLALLGYSPLDPSFNTVTGRTATNWLGAIGSHVSDLLLQLLGWPALALALPFGIAGVRAAQGRRFRARRALWAVLLGAALLAAAGGAIPLGSMGAPAGFGGVIGVLAGNLVLALGDIAALAAVPLALILAVLLVPPGLGLIVWGAGVGFDDATRLGGIGAGIGAWLPRRAEHDDDDATPVQAIRREPRLDRYRAEPEAQPAAPRTLVVDAPRGPVPGKRHQKERQSSLDLGDSAILPGLSLLKPPPPAPARRVDAASLEQNARLLEGVLEDFGVKGRIGEVRPGPVVTMYELEPAPGIKASRVIGLADDIARSMSALSARVAVVPGKNVIGIELPNQHREMVSLSELLGSRAFEEGGAVLPLVLGKDIAGEPVIADLAPMPHLLIAGTTGSGKSVGLNAMILSLLYRLGPNECRMIMIDPKMLELKTYDGIPHLLAPVVTDPPKAIRALKWAVEQMEDRYRQMSAINVRSLANFNQKVLESKASGKPFVRRVQTGWDPETEAPIIEE